MKRNHYTNSKLLAIILFIFFLTLGVLNHLDIRYSSNELGDGINIFTDTVLQDGTDNYKLNFTTGGDADWYYTTGDYYYDGDSIRSGVITHSQTTYVTTTVHGPGTIEFYWQVSSEASYDSLRFRINGSSMAMISGSVSWEYKNFSVGVGIHILRWEYTKDGTNSYYSDCGWVDYVRWNVTPTSLSEDSALQEFYNYSATSYYYRTESASNLYYHVVWLQPTESNNDFNLYLYSDNEYSTQLTSSMAGNGSLDWVVFRPSISQSYYPRGYTHSGTGYAYIEWEVSSYSISVDCCNSAYLSGSECIEIYQISLSSSSTYDFTLDVPSGGDYDLYLYYLNSGSATNCSGYIYASNHSGMGVDESISTYSPSVSGDYAILVVRQSGSGPYYFTAQLSSTSSGLDTSLILIIVGIILIIVGVLLIMLGIKRNLQKKVEN